MEDDQEPSPKMHRRRGSNFEVQARSDQIFSQGSWKSGLQHSLAWLNSVDI